MPSVPAGVRSSRTSVVLPLVLVMRSPSRSSLDTGPMQISRRMIVFDAADLEAESAFWAGLLGGTVMASDRWHNIWVDGEWQLGVQLAPDHVPPEWPDGTPQQIHFDLYIDDLDAAHDEVIGLGGRLLKAAEDRSAVSGAQVYADPAGHPFCLCWLPPQPGDRLSDDAG